MTPVRIEAALVQVEGWRPRLTEALRLRQMAQLDLASASGVNSRVMGYLVKNAKEPPDYVSGVRIAEALDVNPDVLWCVSDAPRPRRWPRRWLGRWPKRWRVFARDHAMTLRDLICEAVDAYIDTTEASEHGYQPPAQVQAATVPVVVMPAYALRETLRRTTVADNAADEERWPDGRRCPRELTAEEFVLAKSKRSLGWSWSEIGEYIFDDTNKSTMRERYERAAAQYTA